MPPRYAGRSGRSRDRLRSGRQKPRHNRGPLRHCAAMAGIAGLADRAQRDGALARSVAWAIPAGAVVAFLALCWTLRHFVTDDAWISVRYAENLAAGHGFVWNAGGPRVEGFSNPLLVSIEALGTMVGLGAIGLARLVGVGSGVALILLLAREGRAAVGVAASRVAVVLVGLSPPLALWAMGGLETLPTALAIAAGVVPLCRDGDRRRAGLVAGIAFATLPWLRPEGLGVVLAVGLAAALPRLARREGRNEAATLAARVCGPAIVSQLILEAVRLTVYGHLLPNSFIYKAGTGGTFDVLRTFAQSAAPVVAAGIVGMLLARGRRRLLAVPPLVYAVGSLGTLDQVDAFGRFL